MSFSINRRRAASRIAARLAVVMFVCTWLLPAARADDQDGIRARSDVWAIATALRHYKEDQGDYPQGDQPAILRTLRGHNPSQIVYFEQEDRYFNGRGELLDPWGTPYRIDIDAKPQPRVSSAGRNKVFDGDTKGSDDIRSWD